MKKCPFCSEEIKDEAKKCRHCGEWLEKTSDEPALMSQPVVTSEAPASSTADSPVEYAGFWIRFVASWIDGIILAFLSIIPVVFVVALFGASETEGQSLGQLVGIAVSLVYYILLTYKKGATWGKMAVGIKVVSEDGTDLSLGKVILRETVGKLLSTITLYIGFIMAAFTKKKQALHDKVASTCVVYSGSGRKGGMWVVILVVIFVAIAVIGILASIVLVSLSAAREKAQAAAFKAEVQALVPNFILTCDERPLLLSDFGTSSYFDSRSSYSTLAQQCGPLSMGNFSFTIHGIDKAATQNASCSQLGCTFSEK